MSVWVWVSKLVPYFPSLLLFPFTSIPLHSFSIVKMPILISILVPSLFLYSTSATTGSSSSSITVHIGASVEISCLSSFPPIWMWYGPKQLRPKSLASDGTRPHPNLKDRRFKFVKKRDIEYVIEISNIDSRDAGKFVCDGETYHEIDLNVVR